MSGPLKPDEVDEIDNPYMGDDISLLQEENRRLRQMVSDACLELRQVSGPLANRIRVYRESYSQQIENLARERDRLESGIQRVRDHLNQRLAQHQENLRLWQNGYLTPTEPDPEERDAIMRELKACIHECQQALERLPKLGT